VSDRVTSGGGRHGATSWSRSVVVLGGGGIHRGIGFVATCALALVVAISLSCQSGDDTASSTSALTGDEETVDEEATPTSDIPEVNTEPVPPEGFTGVVQDSMPLTAEELEAIADAIALNAARNPEGEDPALRGFATTRPARLTPVREIAEPGAVAEEPQAVQP
jgi:hypothetical protein